MIHHINRIESLKVSLDSLEWPAKRATNVSADTSNRCVHHRPRDIARNAALLSSTFRTAPLTITSRHEDLDPMPIETQIRGCGLDFESRGSRIKLPSTQQQPTETQGFFLLFLVF